MIAGFGFRASATEASLRDALARACAGRIEGIDRLAAPADKAAKASLRVLGRRLALVVEPIPPAAIRAAATLTRSPHALAARGTGSVAEAAALAAAGPGARLVGPRAVSADRLATCALAEGAAP